MAGDHADVPVVAGGLEEMFDAVAGGLFFTAGEQHIDAVEIGFDGAGIELESFIEGAAGFEEMHLAAEAVASVLEVGDAEAGPAGGVVFVLFDDAVEELAGAIEFFAAAGAGHEGGEEGAGLEVILGDGLIEERASGEARVLSWWCWRLPKPCRELKTSSQISDWTLTRSKEATLMEPPVRTDWLGTSRSCQLRSKPCSERRKLPARTKLTRSFLPMLSGSS